MSRDLPARVFVISGPSGVGKTTLIRHILDANPDIQLSVSATTRAPRPGEVDGRDYIFLDRRRFEAMIEAGAFLEWARVYGNYYGTSREHVEAILQAGRHALLDIDTQGALSIKRLTAGAAFIFITPPSLDNLRQRLRDRGSESAESLARRLAKAEHEMSHREAYDHVVVNDDVERAARELQAIIDRERQRPVAFRISHPGPRTPGAGDPA